MDLNKKAFLFLLILITQLAIAQKPNIVWISSEDNTAHFLRLYDTQGAETPNIERLAKQGITFNNAYSNAPVCSAARSALISGCYNPRIATQYHRCASEAPMPEGLELYPNYLQAAGYYTTNNSKEDYNVKGKKGWDDSSKKACYRNRKEGQPFFQIWNIGTTHESRVHFPKKDVETLKTVTNPDEIKVFPYHQDTKLMRYTYARYLDKHMEMDKQVGEYIAMLEEDGELENTIIFYFGDNGGVLPRSKAYAYDNGVRVPLVVYFPAKYQHLMPAKQGERIDGFVSFIDFAPTLLNLIGEDIPSEMDGKPFLGENISKKELNKRDENFAYADRFDEKYDMVRSYRKGDFHYIRSYLPFSIDGLYNMYRYKQAAFAEAYELYAEGKLNEVQAAFFEPRQAEMLFDLSKDPHEVNDLSQDPRYKGKLLELRDKLNTQVISMPDLSFYPESHLAKVAFDNPTQFGQEHKNEIKALQDIANLNYQEFDTVKKEIAKALKSENKWERYWGLIVCSSFGKEAIEFKDIAQTLSIQDKEPLVRVRAAEFLSLTLAINPSEVIEKVCRESKDQLEVLMTLNTASLLKMNNPSIEYHLTKEQFPSKWTEGKGSWIQNHLDFLNGKGLIMKKQ